MTRFRFYRASALLMAAVVLAGCSSAPLDPVALASVHEPMPMLSGPTTDGGSVDLRDDAGKPMVVNAWASWCYPCRQEQPMLDDLYERYGDRVTFLGVNSKDDSKAAALEHAREFAIPYPSLWDQDGTVAIQQLKLDVGLPGTVVADASGTMRYRVRGQIHQAELVAMIESVLAA